MKAIKIMKIIGKLLSLLSVLPVIVFFTYYIMASIKLGEFATVESDYNPFYDTLDGVSIYNFFSRTMFYLIDKYPVFCFFIPYSILSLFNTKLRLNKNYYLIWIVSFILLITIYLSKDLGGWMFD
ncbi:MAG: hypothetical protein K1X55_09350 [Chitinophagales bacterium]|nr:hypothetical protein [Chitinophagales bacterium]